MKRSAVFMLFTVFSAVAFGQDFQAWQRETTKAYGECRFSGAAASILGRVTPEDIKKTQNCVDASIEKSKVGFAALIPHVKATASTAIKDYYAAWIGGMKTLPSLLLHENGQANVSAQATRQRLNELWARFEVEAGL